MNRNYFGKKIDKLLSKVIINLLYELVVLSWCHDEHKFDYNIKISFTDVGIIFVKRVCCFGMQFK